MSQLTIYSDADSDNVLLRTDDLSQIESELGEAGIRIERWKADRDLSRDIPVGIGITLYVYSSGSVGAQKLLFGHSDAGDLCPVFSGYFDTQIGHKREADAYRNISRQIALPAEGILFLSDVLEELDAAAEAGMQTMQLVRNEDAVTGSHRIAHDFHEVVLFVERYSCIQRLL